MQPDISFLVEDPDLGSIAFSVIRSAGSFDHGELVQQSVTHQALGIIQPEGFSVADPQTGEDKTEAGITVYTRFALTAGDRSADAVTLADVIRYRNRSWRVREVKNWTDLGYNIARASLIRD